MNSFKHAFFFLLGFTSCFVQAQTVVVCASVSESGEAVKPASSWTLKSEGQVYFLFRNATAIETSKLLFFVDKKNEQGAFIAFDTKTVKPENSRNWSGIEYAFSKTGEYKITVGDARGKTLAETTCTIQVQQSSASAAAAADDYYSGARIRFCSQLDGDGKPVLYGSTFSVANGSPIQICIDHVQTLKTSSVSIEIMTGDGFHEKVETKKVAVKSSEMFAAIPYVFPKAGQYKITVYTADDKFINSGTVTVRFQ